MNVLMVLTSNDKLGNSGGKTGFWLEEFAAPYYVLSDAGVDLTLASPKGGQPPVDPRSEEPQAQTEFTKRFKRDKQAQERLASTEKLSDISPDGFDGVFYPGGHGPLWDLAEDQHSIKIIEKMAADGKTVSAVCHGPAAFRHPKSPDGSPLVKGKSVTSFSNSEERAIGLAEAVPFLVEDVLKQNGATYRKGNDWEPYAVVDGNLVTGQNPASSEGTAWLIIDRLLIELSEENQQKRDRALVQFEENPQQPAG
jgi:putative intracellular protease/amidase